MQCAAWLSKFCQTFRKDAEVEESKETVEQSTSIPSFDISPDSLEVGKEEESFCRLTSGSDIKSFQSKTFVTREIEMLGEKGEEEETREKEVEEEAREKRVGRGEQGHSSDSEDNGNCTQWKTFSGLDNVNNLKFKVMHFEEKNLPIFCLVNFLINSFF